MPSYQQIREALIALATAEHDIERYYAIDDDLVMYIHVEIVGGRRRRHRRMPQPVRPLSPTSTVTAPTAVKDGDIEIEPRIAVAVTNRNTRYVEWEELTSKQLHKVAHYKAALEHWIAGGIMDLPPSDTGKPIYDPSKDE